MAATSQPSRSTATTATARREPMLDAGREPMLDAAARWISETAHDLRSPLTTVRESIRLVRDGDLGPLTPGQEISLGSALDQCNCINQMVEELVQLDRLRSGAPRVFRRWVPIIEVRRRIEETLRPWALPRHIEILWDGDHLATTSVFVDPAMLRRLVVNLVTNALRVTPENGQILIRLDRVENQQIRWTVIDWGNGMRPETLSRIASRKAARDERESWADGEGLGLSICRQLAGLHFSSLAIRSRVGRGTEVSFQVPSGGPHRVAQAWVQWRLGRGDELPRSPDGMTAEGKTFHRQTILRQQGIGNARSGKANLHVRLDSPSVTVTLPHQARAPQQARQLSVCSVRLGATMSKAVCQQFDALLQGAGSFYDLIYRVNTRHWVWMLDADAKIAIKRIRTIQQESTAEIDDLRADWSPVQTMAIEANKTAHQLGDRLVKATLASGSPRTTYDNDQVRPGTSPIVESEIAATRLEAELERLSSRVDRQANELNRQAEVFKPGVAPA